MVGCRGKGEGRSVLPVVKLRPAAARPRLFAYTEKRLTPPSYSVGVRPSTGSHLFVRVLSFFSSSPSLRPFFFFILFFFLFFLFGFHFYCFTPLKNKEKKKQLIFRLHETIFKKIKKRIWTPHVCVCVCVCGVQCVCV